jgi:lipooligosaccharide transport system permease protein
VTAVTLAARVLPRAALGGNRSWRLVQRNLVASRRYWLVIVSGFFEPLFYLVGIGIGVGTLVGDIEVGGRDVSYQEFVAPALLAASAMNGAVYETTGNVFFKLKYAKTYEGVLATPLRVGDVAVAELTFALMRGTVYGITFVLVMLALGLVGSAWAVLLVPGALLVGAAFAAVGLAATSMMRSWADFGYVELATLPLFLFSATFVPLAEYPDAAQWILPLTPLYHGVELLRAFTLGDVGVAIFGHVAYLLVMVAVGLVVAAKRLERTLLK